MDGTAWQNLWFVFCLSGGCLSAVTPTTYGSRHSAVSLDLNATFNPSSDHLPTKFEGRHRNRCCVSTGARGSKGENALFSICDLFVLSKTWPCRGCDFPFSPLKWLRHAVCSQFFLILTLDVLHTVADFVSISPTATLKLIKKKKKPIRVLLKSLKFKSFPLTASVFLWERINT